MKPLMPGCLYLLLVSAAIAAQPGRAQSDPDSSSFTWCGWTLINTYPHDTTAFTKGRLYHDGFLYESTGRRGQSELRKVDLDIGKVPTRTPLDPGDIRESLTHWNDKLIQLTLNSGSRFVYDLSTFQPLRTFLYEGEGWGIARTERNLVVSDGSEVLRFLDPDTFQVIRTVTVTDNGVAVKHLNERS